MPGERVGILLVVAPQEVPRAEVRDVGFRDVEGGCTSKEMRTLHVKLLRLYSRISWKIQSMPVKARGRFRTGEEMEK